MKMFADANIFNREVNMLDNITEIIRHNTDLKIDLEIIDLSIDSNDSISTREVVRGIAIRGNKILVVYPKDEIIYGTPGGGVEALETKIEALQREMREEVGALKIEIKEYLGVMSAIRKSVVDPNIVFNPIHHYFLIDILEFGEPKLEQYEQDLNLKHKFVDIDEVIEYNELAIKNRNQAFLDFYTNQTILFKELKKRLFPEDRK